MLTNHELSRQLVQDVMNTLTAMNISAVERETGLGKDTLSVWERRYGFPQPTRDDNGERVYLARIFHDRRGFEVGGTE